MDFQLRKSRQNPTGFDKHRCHAAGNQMSSAMYKKALKFP